MIRPVAAIALAIAASLACAAPPTRPASAPAGARATPAPPPAAPSVALRRVERVIDGDTIELAGGERVRVLGIDAPELRAADPAVRAAAKDASSALARSLGPTTHVEATGVSDRYGRTLAYLAECPDGEEPPSAACEDVGARLVAEGHARAYPTEHARLMDYIRLEAEARRRGERAWSAAVVAALDPPAEVDVTVAEAGAHVGRRARVTGRLARAHRSEKALFLTLEDGGASLTAVAFKPAFPHFPAVLLDAWQGRRLAVTGRVKLYRGEAEIVLEHPSQVEDLGP